MYAHSVDWWFSEQQRGIMDGLQDLLWSSRCDNLETVGSPGDRIGLTSFETAVDEVSIAGLLR